HCAHPDRTCTDNQHGFPGIYIGTTNTMCSYGKWLNKSKRVESNSTAGNEVFRWHHKVIRHAPINMDTAYLKICATISLALAACDTMTTTEVRKKGHDVARPERACTIHLNDLTSQLVAEDARIGKVGLCSLKGVQISATNADSPHAQQRFLFARNRCVSRTVTQGARRLTDKYFHVPMY